MANYPVACPSCKTTYRVSESLIGKKCRCKKCGDVFVASREGKEGSPPAILKHTNSPAGIQQRAKHKVQCPFCQAALWVTSKAPGESVRCSECELSFKPPVRPAGPSELPIQTVPPDTSSASTPTPPPLAKPNLPKHAPRKPSVGVRHSVSLVEEGSSKNDLPSTSSRPSQSSGVQQRAAEHPTAPKALHPRAERSAKDDPNSMAEDNRSVVQTELREADSFQQETVLSQAYRCGTSICLVVSLITFIGISSGFVGGLIGTQVAKRSFLEVVNTERGLFTTTTTYRHKQVSLGKYLDRIKTYKAVTTLVCSVLGAIVGLWFGVTGYDAEKKRVHLVIPTDDPCRQINLNMVVVVAAIIVGFCTYWQLANPSSSYPQTSGTTRNNGIQVQSPTNNAAGRASAAPKPRTNHSASTKTKNTQLIINCPRGCGTLFVRNEIEKHLEIAKKLNNSQIRLNIKCPKCGQISLSEFQKK